MSDNRGLGQHDDPPTGGGRFRPPCDREVRYRVVEVLHIDSDSGEVTSADIQHYKTPDGAQECLARWIKGGKSAVMQKGDLRWLPGDEDPRLALGITVDDSPQLEQQDDPPTWGGRLGIPGDRELRYRVVVVLHIDPGTGRVTAGGVQEFKTPGGAQRCLERWVAAGKSAVTQPGVLRWLPADSGPQALPGTLVDDQ